MSVLGIFETLAGTVDALLGVPVTITPRAGGRISAASIDATRVQKTIVGEFANDPGVADIFKDRTHGHQSLGNTRALLPNAIVSISATQYALLGYDLRKNDLVTISDRGETYTISSPPEMDDLGSVRLVLSSEVDPL